MRHATRPRLDLPRPSRIYHRAIARRATIAQRGKRIARALPWGMLGALGLITLIEAFLATRVIELSDPVALSWRRAAHAAHAEAPEASLLIAGDSLIMHGLVPALVERSSQLHPANMAAARAPALFSYFMIRRALDAGAKPRAIVFATKPAVLIGGPAYNARYWQEVLTPREFAELISITPIGTLATELAFGRALPSFRSRLEANSWLSARFAGKPDPVAELNRALWRNWTVNRGSNVIPARPPFTGELTPAVAHNLFVDHFHVDYSNSVAVDRLLALAESRAIPIYWLLMPLSPVVQARRDSSGAEQKFESFVRLKLAAHPRAVVLDARRSGFPAEAFGDATHLNIRGAACLSALVASRLEAQLKIARPAPEERWVVLGRAPHPLPPPPNEIEDVETSKRLVGSN